MGKLDGKVAIVTAAGRGIGKGMAIALAGAGARVAVNSYGEATTQSTVDAILSAGGEAFGYPGDITQPQVMVDMAAATIERYGQIDVLVNNVGAGPKDQITPTDEPLALPAAMWDALYQQNLRPVVLMSEAVLPHMRERGTGKIINITSIAGRATLGAPMLQNFVPPAYGAMKAALVSHTQTLADLEGPNNINVNAIAPGIVYTDAWAGNAKGAVNRLEPFKGMDPRTWFEGIPRGDYPDMFPPTPLRREQTVEDIGNAAVFLASDDSINITGQCLMVDGGMVKL